MLIIQPKLPAKPDQRNQDNQCYDRENNYSNVLRFLKLLPNHYRTGTLFQRQVFLEEEVVRDFLLFDWWNRLCVTQI